MPYNQEWYQANREAVVARHRRNKAVVREKVRAIRRASTCMRCGEDDPRCLDFHHRDPATKSFNIGSRAGWGYGWERMQEEIAKCDVLCANCHRKEHCRDDML